MKSYTLPTISSESLGNSLFECAMLDASKQGQVPNPDEPLRIGVGIICVCLRGGGSFYLNDHFYKISRGTMVTLLPNSVIRNMESSEDFLGYAITADIKFMMSIQMSDVVRSYVHISSNPVLKITKKQTETIIELCEVLKRKRDESDHPFRDQILRHLLVILCYEIHSFYREHAEGDAPESGYRSRQGGLCQEFLELVEVHATEHREMGFYADRLCITPKYLSVVVKKVSGRSPVEWIDRTVMLYARTLLTSSDMTVQQISAELNFPNPSFFGQYFKRHEGITPKQYRSKTKS